MSVTFHCCRIFEKCSRSQPFCRPKITPAARIRLDLKCSAVFRKRFHQFRSHRHIRRFLRILANNFNLPTADFRAQQQRRRKLRTFLDAHAAFLRHAGTVLRRSIRLDSAIACCPKNYRRQFVVLIFRFDAIAQFAQRLKQRRLRTFVHPRHAVQPINAIAQTNERRQKPRRRARIADEQFQRLLLPCRRSESCRLRRMTVMVRLQNSSGSGSTFTTNPSFCRHSTMICVSSLQSAPLSVTSPSASAARISARFVMLLEPGTVISARTGLSSGTISMRSGRPFLTTDGHR